MSKTARAKPRRYALNDAFFKKAINGAIMDSLMFPVSLGERHDVKLKPQFETACWAYLPPHNIYVGTDLFEKDCVKLGLSEELQSKYVANHYHHEMAHALYTERDMKKIKRELALIKAPFGTYNLFEDGYIEHRYRTETEYRFEWLMMEDLSLNARPECLLFALIQAEGRVETVEKAIQEWKPAPVEAQEGGQGFKELNALLSQQEAPVEKLLELLPEVVDYYKRIIAVKHSLKLMPILKEWLDQYGRPPEMPRGGGLGDMSMNMNLMSDPQAAQQFDADAVAVSGPQSGGESEVNASQRTKHQDKVKADPSHEAEASNGKVLLDTETPVDMKRAQAVAEKLLKFLQKAPYNAYSRNPSARLSARHYVLGRPAYRVKEDGGKKVPKVLMVMDCSGSMNGFHMTEGKIFLTALSLLAQWGVIKGHLVLSAVREKPTWERFALPMAQKSINQVQGYAGGEGLEYAIRANMAQARDADLVFVYTDAAIGDLPVNKTRLHQQGVFTWGLYVGDESQRSALLEHFDKALIRSSAEELVDAIVVQQR